MNSLKAALHVAAVRAAQCPAEQGAQPVGRYAPQPKQGTNTEMRTSRLTLAAALGLTLAGCHPIEAQGEILHVVGNNFTTSEDEAQLMLEVGEELLPDIAALHPEDIVLDDAIRVELRGDFGESPFVDDEGTVHLWRFSEAEGGYNALYAHELVHAIAYDNLVGPALEDYDNSGFYLEGWAEYVALLVDPGKTGFSLFGVDEDVVVGHWLLEGGPTLADYRERHDELSLHCQGQSYILRASWFRYVDEELGREVLLDLAAGREGWDREAVEAVLGASLEQVDADWEAWATQRYDAHPDADAKAEAYRREKMSWYQPCVD